MFGPLLFSLALLGQDIDFARLDGQLKVLEQERLVLVSSERQLAAVVADNQRQLAALYKQRNQQYKYLRQRLLAYKSLQPSVKAALLTRSASLEQVLRQLQLLRFINSQDRRLLQNMQDNQSRLAALKAELIKKEAQLARYRQANEEKQDELAALRLDAMQVLLAAAGQAPAATAAGFAEQKGHLPWPVAGQVVDGNTRTLSITAAAAAVVTAVGPGQVLFSGPVPGYNQLIILDHGDNYYSIYGNLSRAAVPSGSSVQSGQLLGLLAGAQAPDQPTLYFELRRKNAVIEALPWLMPQDGGR